MAPNQKADDRDADAGSGDEAVAEDALAREAGHHFADDAHARQNHDVDGRMRVEPEHVLEQDGIAADGGIEDADMEAALQSHQRQRDGDHRRAQHLDQRGGVVGPDEERQAAPGHPGRAHLVDGDDEVQARQNGRKPGDEDAARRP